MIRIDTRKRREVSKLHATISKINFGGKKKWAILDHDTTNGTFVNRRKIKKHILVNGDEIVFGGGPDFNIGDKLQNTDNSDTRFIFMEPLPAVSLSDGLDLSFVLNDPEEEHCPICYEPLYKRIVLPCGHYSCPKCLKEWVNKLVTENKVAFCPQCRKQFRNEDLLSGDFIYKGQTLMVQSLDPILRKVNLSSGDQLMGYSITNDLSDEQISKLVGFISKLKKKPDRIYILMALTNCMPLQIENMSPGQLTTIIRNFGGDIDLDMPQLLNEALCLVYHNIYKNLF